MTVGALHSELRIDLHTFYAISTWQGRERSEHKGTIIGMPRFFRLVSGINKDSQADNPYADAVMYHIENLIDDAHQEIQCLLNEINQLFTGLPSGITLSDVVSSEPLNIAVHSHTPVGYRCVYLLVGFDQLALKLFQAYHYGFISRQHRDHQLQESGYLLRKIFTVAMRYRSFPVNRQAFVTDDADATLEQARDYFGELDEAILLGKKRSRFSPPVNAESLRLLNNRLPLSPSKAKVDLNVDKQGNRNERHESE
nr:TIGR03761 family integrating conjugative element protein [Chania multitudinisentens]